MRDTPASPVTTGFTPRNLHALKWGRPPFSRSAPNALLNQLSEAI